MKLKLSFFVFCGVLLSSSAFAGELKGRLPANYRAMSISNGAADSSSDTSFTLSTSAATARLYLLDSTGSLTGPVISGVKYKGKYYSYADAKKKGYCRKSSARLVMGLRPGSGTLNVGTVKVKAADGVGYLNKLPSSKKLDKSSLTVISNKSKCYPAGTGDNLGLASTSNSRIASANLEVSAVAGDADGDGLLDVVDVDEDNDGVMNAYDSDTTSGGTTSFRVFSNLKLNIERSLNRYVQTLTSTNLDTAANEIGLAIEVAGSNTDTVELDCQGLNYCSSGGTGLAGGAFPDSVDSDSDGLGTITAGGTGDFQLRPNVSASSAIGGGDTYIEVVRNTDGVETSIPGMLNFVFFTTPVITSVTMGATTYTPVYPATNGMQGSQNDPFAAPGGWDGILTLTAYRPQRPGITSSEGEYVDVGNSLITIDIPNAPCSGGGGCGGSGPGNCGASFYTETDANLESNPNGLRDTRGDQDTDLADPTDDTVTFSIDLAGCLADRSIAWNSGERLAIDLQFRNSFGDNAAQKVYVQKP